MTAKSDPRDPSVTMTIRLPQSVKEALTEEAWTRRMTPNKYAARILADAARPEKDNAQPLTGDASKRHVARVLEPNGEIREFDPLTGRLAPRERHDDGLASFVPTPEAVAEMSVTDEEFREAIESRKRASVERAKREWDPEAMPPDLPDPLAW